MADGLFDNRYRYDHIYPRGRSGETLRAFDTENEERPVVIKRPAPNDAPPIRAGQEVSILNERKALIALQGHPVVTEYIDSGHFSVGGMPHQYIVMERAEGSIIEQDVLDAARNNGGRLPFLEVLVIADRLLDLIDAAHQQEIVYNDVDAKHLFWNRSSYSLKVIDWGNAVFLEGDRITPQGISIQTDIYQVGELLYFILTGGRRAEIPRDVGEDFLLDFGDDDERVPLEIRKIVSQAVHPNLRYRYQNARELQRILANFRQPLERERDTILNRVIERLRHELSKNQLQGLLTTLEPALLADPGHPTAREAHQSIGDRLRDLNVSADLDAAMIYMRGENWQRAIDLLGEMRDRTGSQTRPQVELLSDSAVLLMDSPLVETPAPIKAFLTMIYEGRLLRAAHTLLITDQPDNTARRLQWLLAERVSSRVPDILLLRPNLYRLALSLNAVNTDGVNLNEARELLVEINAQLDAMPEEIGSNLVRLRDSYRAVVDKLNTLNQLLSTVAVQEQLSNRHLPLSALDRAINAAMALADNMHVIGKQATGSPRDALAALDNSHNVDPVNPLWGMIRRMLDNLYELLQSYQTYVPTADGSDLDGWLKASHHDLKPFESRLFDELLVELIDGLKVASERWTDYGNMTVQGQRLPAVQALNRAMQSVSTISPTLASWLNQLRGVVENAAYVERHTLSGGLGRALADGWDALDRGRLADAERLGSQAKEIARSENERDAAIRLFTLASAIREWIERNGINSPQRTNHALGIIDALFTEEEAAIRDDFATQMPGKEPYLRAMQRGMVEIYNRQSTPGLRLYFFQAVLLGALEAYDSNLEDAIFWRDAATRALEEHGPRHIATRTLDEFVARRRDVIKAEELLAKVSGKHAIESLTQTRRAVEENPQARSLTPAIQALREMEASFRDWADGEFKAAGMKLENALKSINKVASDSHLDLNGWRIWTESLNAAAAELHNYARQMRQTIERRPNEPDSIVRDAHRILAERTEELLGEQFAGQLKQYHQTYESFLAVYADKNMRRSGKIEQFNEMFRAMFIDRHPAYPLFQHWYDVLESAPEFPAPPTDEPVPRIDENDQPFDDLAADPTLPGRYVEADGQGNRRRWFRILGVLIVPAIIAVIFILTSGDDNTPNSVAGDSSPTAETTPDETLTDAMIATAEAAASAGVVPDTVTPIPTLSMADLVTPTLVTPTHTPIPTERPTNTPITPTDTPTMTDTPTLTHTPIPTNTPIPSATPTPTVPASGVRGLVGIIDLMERLLTENEAAIPWDQDLFHATEDRGTWRLATEQDTAEGDDVLLVLPVDLMTAYYGEGSAVRLRRTDVTFDFVTYNAAQLELEDVAFGLLLRDANDPQVQVGVMIQIASPNLNAVNLYIQEGDEREFIRQVAVNSLTGLRLRLDRDPISGAMNILFNDTQVNRGAAIPFTLPDAVLEPVLVVRDDGVVLSVRNWRVSLP